MNKKWIFTSVVVIALLAVFYNLGRAQTTQPASVLVCVKKTDGSMWIIQNIADCKDRGTVLNMYTQGGVDTQLASSNTSISSLTSQLAAAQASIAALTEQVNNQSAQIAALQTTVTSMNSHEARLTVVEDKLEPFSRSGNDITLTGVNLHIVNGMGNTETTNGLGNLIIGYNESRPDPSQDARTGSHMLVVGMRNNFTGYGGIVAGLFNETSGDFASVTGGYINKASGSISSVTGGKHNTASGPISSVNGGYDNEASNSNSTVSGGESNIASGISATVSGGKLRVASGYHNWVAGELFQEY